LFDKLHGQETAEFLAKLHAAKDVTGDAYERLAKLHAANGDSGAAYEHYRKHLADHAQLAERIARAAAESGRETDSAMGKGFYETARREAEKALEQQRAAAGDREAAAKAQAERVWREVAARHAQSGAHGEPAQDHGHAQGHAHARRHAATED